MGEGKTVVSWTALWRIMRERRNTRALIVAPIKVAVQTWPGELDEWTHLQYFKGKYVVLRPDGTEPEIAEAKANAKHACDVLNIRGVLRSNLIGRAETKGQERARRRLVRTDAPVHIVNRELLPWLWWFWGNKWPYDTVIFDESSGLRSHKSERFRALAKARPYIRRLIELTGTPKPETYLDIFPQIWLLDKGARLGKNVTKFRNQWFAYHEPSHKWVIRKGAAEPIIRKIADIVLVQQNLSGEHDPLLLDRPVTFEPDIADMYAGFERDAILEIDDFRAEGETAGALAQKLLQFASGAVYDANRRYKVVHNYKIEELRQIEDEAMGSPLAVAYWHQSSLARLKAAFPHGVTMDKEGKLQHPWNAGEVPMMFLHPASAGHGLNLQKGPGHMLAFFDIPYPLELYLQIIKRFARSGQARQVKVFHISANGTIDAGIVPLLKRKQSSQEYLMQRITELRERMK